MDVRLKGLHAGHDRSSAELRRARISVSLIFLIHGILVSNWLSRIPTVQISGEVLATNQKVACSNHAGRTT
jgi:hypothetical protein